jgi:hypothetical protein
MLELFLTEYMEDIGLVFEVVSRPPDLIFTGFVSYHTSIMTGSEIVCSDRESTFQQEIPADDTVAGQAWVGGNPLGVPVDKALNYSIPEDFFGIHSIERDA